MKFRSRIAIAVLVSAALPLMLVKGYGVLQRCEDAAREADLALTGNAQELAGLLAATRTIWIDSTRALAGLPEVEAMLDASQPPDPVYWSRWSAAIGGRDPVNLRSIGLVDLRGRVRADSRVSHQGRDESGEPWFSQTLASGATRRFDTYDAAESDLIFAALVRDAAGQRRGLLRLRVDTGLFSQVLVQAMLARPQLSASLTDAEGRILLGVGADGERPLPRLPEPSGPTPVLADVGAERVAVIAVAGSDWRVLVRQPRADWAAPQRSLLQAWLLDSFLLLALLLGTSLLLGWRIARPLAHFRDIAERIGGGDYRPVEPWRGAEEARQLSIALDTLAARLGMSFATLSQELQQRRAAETALDDSRALYLELVEHLPGAVYRCTNHPGWPMAYLSPQIETITGYRAEELLAGDGRGLTALIPSEYVAANEVAVAAALQGDGRYDLRYELRHRDGRMRWIWELGSVHHGSGGSGGSADRTGPDELTGVLFDVTDRETLREAMELLRGRLDTEVGGDFFTTLASGLGRLLDAEIVLIGRFLGTPPQSLRSLALANSSGRSEDLEFAIAGTPEEAVLTAGRLDCADEVQKRFPDDAHLVRYGIRSYLGRRLDARDGRPLGVLAVAGREPLPMDAATGLLLDLFQARAATELERSLALEELRQLADTLEQRVAERSAALEATNAALALAMSRLVQREKLVALGNLVAGVAHELNTPIGNALIVSTALHEAHLQLGDQLADGQLKRSVLDRFIAENVEAAQLIERNLQRAATMINQFKQIAVDQASMRRRRFDLGEVVTDVLLTLSPRLKRVAHGVSVDIPAGITLDSYPGPLEQVLNNLIENSLVHAFAPDQTGRIRISAQTADGRVHLRYDDDGSGIAADLRQRVFDPFFTTRLGQGGSGLGLYLVYNLVHGPLGGSIQLVDCAGPGTCFVIELPAIAPVAMEDARS